MNPVSLLPARQTCFLFILILTSFWTESLVSTVSLDVDLNSQDVRGPLDHFWKSTGFCPPKPHNKAAAFDLGLDMQQNLAYIGAVPFKEIEQVRVHWLLDLLTVTGITEAGPKYDFTNLDKFLSLLNENGLRPGFELMGNPSSVFTDMENKTQVYWWRDLVRQTAQRFVEQYGLPHVQKWNFETWNEPDCHDFDTLKMTPQGFVNYYDACSEGLISVSKTLKLGGPGNGCALYAQNVSRNPVYADALFQHVINGTNYFTGEKGVRLDFISDHQKGQGKGANVLLFELMATKAIYEKYPELKSKPFYNDEADPLVGWSKPFLWRANSVYAGLVVKVITQHQNILKSSNHRPIPNYSLLSNDNGFLSYYPHQFTQRTLLARFQMNQTNHRYVTFVRKPVYTAMTLLALLGERQVHCGLKRSDGIPVTTLGDIGCLASLHVPDKLAKSTSDSWQMSLLVYSVSDPDPGKVMTPFDLKVNWTIDPPPGTEGLKLMIYKLNNTQGNPFKIWAEHFNMTHFPTLEQFDKIRQQENPSAQLLDIPVQSNPLPLPHLNLYDPEIVLFHLCGKPSTVPEQVTGVRFLNVTAGQVLVVWNTELIKTKCLLTYEVELSQYSPQGPYHRVNKYNSIVTAFLHETASEAQVRGYYRVCAVDYWGRRGDYSKPAAYSS